jgi:hypothetical protein
MSEEVQLAGRCAVVIKKRKQAVSTEAILFIPLVYSANISYTSEV